MNPDRREELAVTLMGYDAPDHLVAAARAGTLTLEALAQFEESKELTAGLTLVVGAAYVDSCFVTDGRTALEKDPALNEFDRQLLLGDYSAAVWHTRPIGMLSTWRP